MSFDKLVQSIQEKIGDVLFKVGLPLKENSLERSVRGLLAENIGNIDMTAVNQKGCGYFIDDGKICFGACEKVQAPAYGIGDPMRFMLDNFPLLLSWALKEQYGVPFELKVRLLEATGASREEACKIVEEEENESDSLQP